MTAAEIVAEMARAGLGDAADRLAFEIIAYESDRGTLRRLLLRWLQIVNKAEKDAATVAEWDQLRQETDAAIKATSK